MKLFECQNCGQPLYFENTHCESCGLKLGYLPERRTVTALDDTKGGLRAFADAHGRYRFCANAAHASCNWLMAADNREQFCLTCRHNRTIPDLSIAQNLVNWRKMEAAKHRLFYSLIELKLPLANRQDDPAKGLAFDVLVSTDGPVMTGHADGVITIN